MAIGKISNFKSALTHGGARPSLFDVTVNGPISAVDGLEALGRSQYQCTTTSIPGLPVTPIERQYFGRTVKLPGELTFGTIDYVLKISQRIFALSHNQIHVLLSFIHA